MRALAARLALACAVLLATPALAQQADQGGGVGRGEPVQQDAPPGAAPSRDHPPMFDPRRYTEDYRYLADETQRSGAWRERLKYIPLDEAESVVLTLGGEVRIRGEAYDNNLFSRKRIGDQAYVWERVLPYADLHLGQHVRLFGQVEAAYSQGQKPGPSPLDETRTDLLQGFVELTTSAGRGDLAARIGRQVISYGDGSLIDSRYGPNVLQSFDGAFVDYRRSGWRADLFWARPVRNGLNDFDDRTDVRQQIWRAIIGRDLPGLTCGVLDFYYFGFENSQASFNGKTGRELRHTVGLRHAGGIGALDWKGELIGQFGSFGSGDIGAYAAAGEVGYALTRGVDLRLTLADFEPGRFLRSTGPVAPARLFGAETRFWF